MAEGEAESDAPMTHGHLVEERLTEERRQRILDDIAKTHPQLVDRVAGELAGPESEDRLDVPPWEYLDYVARRPDVSLEQLSAYRFPIDFYDKGFTITSIDEERRAGLPGFVDESRENVIRKYELIHAAGGMAWNSATRSVICLKPQADLSDAYAQWGHEIRTSRERRSSDE